ncbi:unnamed protein product [Cylicocyclus nassatus]|uniref:Uncharacterized protein n=1 Tax=Cylicocyclus nassatus TaxID=53992 RepID=A0AA36M501_CYLNA|nr:unnamed protein product [Cylicocyclus nassatus]
MVSSEANEAPKYEFKIPPDGFKRHKRSLAGFKCVVVLLCLSVITPAHGQYLSDKGMYQQQPMLVQPIRCDCPTFGLADAFAHATNFLLLLISFFY